MPSAFQRYFRLLCRFAVKNSAVGKERQYALNRELLLVTASFIICGSARLHAGFRRALRRSGRSKARLELFSLKIATPGSARHRLRSVSYTHLRAHETPEHLVCRLLLEKKK